jgi:outer membrane protein assembly factor BamB
MVATEQPSFDTWQDAPPVRGGMTDGPLPADANGALPYGTLDLHPEAPPRRGWGLKFTVLLLFLIALVAGGAYLFHSSMPSDEAQRLTRAEAAYKEGDFGEAANLFSSLAKDFPESDERGRYQFLAELSAVREPVRRTHTDKDETLRYLKQLNDFLVLYKADANAEKYYADIADTLYKLVDELTGFAAKDKDRRLLDAAKQVNAEAAQYKIAAPARAKTIEEGFAQAQREITAAETRTALLDRLSKALEAPTLEAVEQALQWAKQAALADDPEIKAKVDKLPSAYQASIIFIPDVRPALTAVPDDVAPSAAFLQYRGLRPTDMVAGTGRPVLALVRGVLYALDPTTGLVRWVRRVGVDNTELPTWLPANAVAPAGLLLCESGTYPDGRSSYRLVALNAESGTLRWAQELPEPGTGKPVIVGDRAFVACPSGAVYEIEITGGRRLGRYELGQSLRHGGLRHPNSTLLYFPGERSCLYALDVAAQRCTGILFTGHAGGALRCPPVVLSIQRGPVGDLSRGLEPAHLLLCQDTGNRSTLLTTYSLPLGETPPAAHPLGDRLDGRLAFPPLVSADQVSLVTDTGAVAIFGLKQRDSSDPDIFPLLREPPDRESASGPLLPAQVVADGQNFWMLARGRLRLFQVTQSAGKGWQIVPRMVPLTPLGAALQEPQVFIDGQGTMLFVVTESLDGGACWMTAIDAGKQAVRWQRQLGAVSDRQPVSLAGKVLMPDRGGSLLLFDADQQRELPGPWVRLGKSTGPPPASGSQFWVLPATNASAAIVLQWRGREAELWKYQDSVTTPVAPARELPALPAGDPALVGETVLLPLASGKLARLSAAELAVLDPWRSSGAEQHATCHIAATGTAKVATTDGSQGLTLWRFDGKTLESLRELKMKARIVGLAALPGGPEVRLCVADAGRNLTLLHGDSLQKTRSWALSDDITTGPFVREGMIYVILGGRRLVWIDPEKDQPVHPFTCQGNIVGQPEVIDGVLIVADDSGQLQGFDPKTGSPNGLGYRLQADVAPAATPVAFGQGRLLVPLTDGTVLLPSRAWFRSSILGFQLRR